MDDIKEPIKIAILIIVTCATLAIMLQTYYYFFIWGLNYFK